MSTITTGKRGRTIKLTPAERVKLAKRLSTAMEASGLGVMEVATASTLSPATITSRVRDHGAGHAGEHLAVWSLVALADGLGLDPARVARTIGVQLSKPDIAHSRDVMEQRRARKVEPRMNGNGNGNGHHADGDGDGDGLHNRLELVIVQAAKRVIDTELERRIEATVERKLNELLTV